MKRAILTLGFFLPVTFAQAANISAMKSGEVATHRMERLIALKKIDASFTQNLSFLTVDNKVKDPQKEVFHIAATQVVSASGKRNTLDLYLDGSGKLISFQQVLTEVVKNPTVYPDKQPLTLMDLALDSLIDLTPGHPEYTPFVNGFSWAELVSQTDSSGKMLIKVIIGAPTLTAQKLTVNMNAAGAVLGIEIK